MTEDIIKMTIDDFARRASQNVRRRLLEGEAFEVEDSDQLPDASTPES
jgi:hypothetical protein